MIKIVNKHWYKGEDGSYEWIARPSVLGNPFTHLKGKTTAQYTVSSRDEACEKYEEWIKEELKKDGEVKKEFNRLVQKYKDTGKLVLMCYCAPYRCHGETLAKLIKESINIDISDYII